MEPYAAAMVRSTRRTDGPALTLAKQFVAVLKRSSVVALKKKGVLPLPAGTERVFGPDELDGASRMDFADAFWDVPERIKATFRPLVNVDTFGLRVSGPSVHVLVTFSILTSSQDGTNLVRQQFTTDARGTVCPSDNIHL